MTIVGYFNSLRELGGMRRLVDDDVATRLGKMPERGLARRSRPFVEELTSRKTAGDIPRILDDLELEHVHPRPQKRERWPIDVLLATNMISVGVDVARLGLMVVRQPAEDDGGVHPGHQPRRPPPPRPRAVASTTGRGRGTSRTTRRSSTSTQRCTARSRR